MWNGANVGFANAPLLNAGAIEALELVGTDAMKRTYIPRLVSGEWAGTMCLTEPQAGSDLAAVRTKAVPDGDRYRLRGQKIFITFGEHDMAPNIVHLVLARLPDAPEGTKGISLFIVPKVIVEADGTLGDRHDVYCAGIEHKLGLHGNPTCTMNYGEKTGGAAGYLVGEANHGLEYMFIMMNAARFSVGVQGVGIRRPRVSECARVCEGAHSGPRYRGGVAAGGHDHPSSRRAPYVDDDEGAARSDARVGLRHGRRARPRAQVAR